MKVFSIDGYWKDTRIKFKNYLVSEFNDIPQGYIEDEIFFFGLSEETINDFIKNGNDLHDFEITKYYEV